MTKGALTELDSELLCVATHPDLCREARALVLAAGAVQADRKSFAEVRWLLDNPNLEDFNLPDEIGAECGRQLVRLYGTHEACCSSCAFRLGTVPNQCGTTVLQAIDCCVTGEPFLCHQTGKPCEGWKESMARKREQSSDLDCKS